MRKDLPSLYFREDLQLIGFEIISIEELYNKSNPELLASPKILQFYEIIFIQEGSGKHYVDFQDYNFTEGNIIFIGKNQMHSWQKYKDSKGYVILFTENFLYKNLFEFENLSYDYPYNSSLYSPLISISDKRMFSAFIKLMELIYTEYSFARYEARQEVLQALLRTLILKVKSQLPKPKLLKVRGAEEKLFLELQKALDQNISHTKIVGDYVNILGTSYHQLNACVKSMTNKSVKVFIDDLLILHAKRMLVENDGNITEVAYALGFDEATNFTKFFKKHTHQTPKYFKESILN